MCFKIIDIRLSIWNQWSSSPMPRSKISRETLRSFAQMKMVRIIVRLTSSLCGMHLNLEVRTNSTKIWCRFKNRIKRNKSSKIEYTTCLSKSIPLSSYSISFNRPKTSIRMTCNRILINSKETRLWLWKIYMKKRSETDFWTLSTSTESLYYFWLLFRGRSSWAILSKRVIKTKSSCLMTVKNSR